MDRATLLDRVRGTFFGCAIGDALGYAVEFDSSLLPSRPRVTEKSTPEHYSDDTQMTRAVAEGLIRAGQSKSISTTAEEIAEEFVAWAKGPPEGHRAPGGACMHGCRNLAEGKPWDTAGQPYNPETLQGGGGCGAVMRSSPYGLWHYQDPIKASEWSAQHAQMTHLAPLAKASAAALAAGVSRAVTGSTLHEVSAQHTRESILYTMVAAAKRYDDGTAGMMREAANWAINAGSLGSALDDLVLDKLRGWAGHEAIAASLYCFLRYPHNFTDAVLLAVNSPGDSDSLGAITGALSGAYLGYGNLPSVWVEEVEGRDWIDNLAHRFVDAMGRAGMA